MLGDKKKSSNRLSGLFSKSSGASDSDANKLKSPTPTESTGRLTKVRNRLSSATHLAPEYPPPQSSSPQRPVSLQNPTIQPVESLESTANLAPLEPPPPLGLGDPGSRNVSPSGRSSRPGTPGAESGSEGNLKKLRRKSKLFGGGSPDLSGAPAGAVGAQERPHAWIVGHKGKVPYNLAMLLNGEKVSRSLAEWGQQDNILTAYLGARTLGRARRYPGLPLSANVQQGSFLPHRFLRLRSIPTAHAPRPWHSILRRRVCDSAGISAIIAAGVA